MRMFKSLLPFIVISVIISSCIPVLAKNSSDLFENAFLVRGPDFIESCAAKTDANAVLIIRQQKKIDKEDSVYIISHSQGAMQVTLRGLLDGCEPFFDKDDGDLGLLYAQNKIEWFSDIDALLAIRTEKLSEGKVGIVKQYSFGKRRALFSKEIKKYIPKNDHVNIDTALKFVLPETKTEYIFIGISHFNPSNYEKSGDKVLKIKGFIFSIIKGIPKLLFEEDGLSNIFTVSKLVNNESYEILVHTSAVYQGSYELRSFDGQKFKKDKIVLYQWMD